MIAVSEGHQEKAMTDSGAEMVALRVSDADRNGTMRRLHNAVTLGLIDINEFEQRSSRVSFARTQNELDGLVCDLPGPGAIVTSAADRVELRGWAGSLKRHGEWMVPTRLALVRRLGSIELDLTKARFAGPVVVIELDMRFGSLELRLPEGASAPSTTSRFTWAVPATVARMPLVKAHRMSW